MRLVPRPRPLLGSVAHRAAVLPSPRSSVQLRPCVYGPTTRTRATIPATAPLPPLARRTFSSSARAYAIAKGNLRLESPEEIRNISIIAHIDAGKTTCTERILHLTQRPSGAITTVGSPGDVDQGSTITDFLEAERERGITIQSAAVGPIFWPRTGGQGKRAAISLVDTPGHIDFTVEVERAVRVVDGSVVILDGVEGAEAQTEGVWAQAQRYGVQSHLLFVNKLDRAGASLRRSIISFVSKGLHSRPVVLILPDYTLNGMDQTLTGVLDVMSMERLNFSGPAGANVQRTPLKEGDPAYATAAEARAALVETVASVDEPLLEEMLAADELDGAGVSETALRDAIRRQTLAGTVVPVFCGSGARNIGIQPLLDGIADFLPSPVDRPTVQATAQRSVVAAPTPKAKRAARQALVKHEPLPREVVPISRTDPQLSLLAFKVVWTPQMGPQTFVRVYSGTLQSSSSLFNTRTQTRERLSKMFLPYADAYVEVSSLQAGQIGVIVGLLDTATGDTLIDEKQAAQTKAPKPKKGQATDQQPIMLRSLELPRITIPPPVFSMSIAPRGKGDEKDLQEALAMLVRTDPSLRLDDQSISGEGAGSGQSTLSGMGSLHLEIARGRLKDEFNARASLGDIRVSYRETVLAAVRHGEMLDRAVGGRPMKVACVVDIEPLPEEDEEEGTVDEARTQSPAKMADNVIEVDLGDASLHGVRVIDEPEADGPAKEDEDDDSEAAAIERALRSGVRASLLRGPLSGSSVVRVRVRVHSVETFGPELSPPAALQACVSRTVRQALHSPQAGAVLLEPYMNVTVALPGASVGAVVSDLSSAQQGEVTSISEDTHRVADATQGQEALTRMYLPPEIVPTSTSTASAAADAQAQRRASNKAVVVALAPLSNLVSYSSKLRALTQGSGTFTMAFHGFRTMQPQKQRAILQEMGRSL